MVGRFALSDFPVHLETVLPLFSEQQDICCLPHQQGDLSTVCQSWVGLDIILNALNILCVSQILRALTLFHQENVIVKLFERTGGFCQNMMHDRPKT